MVSKGGVVGVLVLVVGGALIGWRGCAADMETGRLEGALSPGPSAESSQGKPAALPEREEVVGMAVGVAKPDEEVKAEEIPERYRLPEFPIGTTFGEFLADYWGPQWPEYEAAIKKSGFAVNLANINTRDWSEGLPMGTIEDFFDGLLERTLSKFELVFAGDVYDVPGVSWARFDKPGHLEDLVVKSKVFNPEGKQLTLAQRESLTSFLAERAVPAKQIGDDIMFRWEQLITEDVNQITAYRNPIHGKVIISPILSLPWNTQPNKPASDSHPVYNFTLPSVPRFGASNAAGFFNGILTIWAGADSTLTYLYDTQVNANDLFVAEVKAYMSGV